MRGVDLSEEEWEATYAGLRGPGSWPEAELQAHTRKLKKDKSGSKCCDACWAILWVLMVLLVAAAGAAQDLAASGSGSGSGSGGVA